MFLRILFASVLSAGLLSGLQAAETPPSFDAIGQLAVSRHPGALVTEVALPPAGPGQPVVARVILHSPDGLRSELLVDVISLAILADEQKSLQSSAMLPLALGRSESQPSWDALNARVLQVHPGGRVIDASLRRVSHGALLYEVEVLDAEGEEYELVLDIAGGRVLSDRRMD